MSSKEIRSGRWRPALAAALGSAVFLAGCGSGGSPKGQYTATFREFAVPVASNVPTDPIPGSWPDDIAFDDQGDIWFAEHHSNEIGELVPSGTGFTYRGFPVPTPNSEMDSITVDGPRKIVWATENQGNKIVRLDLNAASPQTTEIPVTTSSNSDPIPGDIVVDSSGNPWFTEPYEGGLSNQGALAEINASTNALSVFPVPTQPNGLDGITFDSTGALWFVELSVNKIGRLKNGQFTEVNLPRPNVVPTNIGVDSGGLVWVTEQAPQANAIAVYNPADTTGNPWRELPIPTPNAGAAGLSIDQNGNVWFTEFETSKIGVVPAGSFSVVDFTIPTPNSGPEDVRAAPDGRIYFTEQYGNKIGEIIVPGLTPGS